MFIYCCIFLYGVINYVFESWPSYQFRPENPMISNFIGTLALICLIAYVYRFARSRID